MATKLIFRATGPNIHRGTNDAPADLVNTEGSSGWRSRYLSTSQGAAVTTITRATVAGPTAGIALGFPHEFISDPINADVTISGAITFNLRAGEANMTDNAAINALVYRLKAVDLSKQLIVKTARTTELGTSEAAANFTATPGAGVACLKGDRILVVVFADDAGTMGSGGTVTFWYNGAAGATGDSYLSFTETFGFITATPAGTVIYPTDVDSDVSQSLLEKEMWTSRGAGVRGGTRHTVEAGWTTPKQINGAIQVTNSTSTTVAELGLRDPAERFAQSFVAACSEVASVDVYFSKTGAPGDNVTCEIQTDSSGSPSGSVVATKTDAATSIVNNNTHTFTFSSPAALTIGTTYWVVLKRTGTLDNSNYVQGAGGSAAYPDGQGKFSDNSGGSWSNTTQIDLFIWVAGVNFAWYTKKLTAFTLSGLVTLNLRGAATIGGATGMSLRAQLAIVDSDGSGATVWSESCWADQTNMNGQLSSTEAALTIYFCGDDVAVTDQQRLRLQLYGEDASDAARGATFSAGTPWSSLVWYNGTSGGASGDTFLTLTQSVTEFVPAYTKPLSYPIVNHQEPGFLMRRMRREWKRRNGILVPELVA